MKNTILGIQMLFVAFGALVLVPILTGLDANVALFTAGIGTLIFHIITKKQVPIFLASSFAYIAPIIEATKRYGMKGALGGLVAAGFVKMLFALIVKLKGKEYLNRILPSYVIGPVIIVIGLSLAPVAIGYASNIAADPSRGIAAQPYNVLIAVISFVITVIVSLYARGMFKLVPILFGLIGGYLTAFFLGAVDFSPIVNAPWFAVPNFVLPEFKTGAVLFLIPVALAPMIEHIGDMMVISSVTGNNYLEKPGLHRTLFGDGIATSVAAMFGGPPNTTYSEVTGAVALTKVYNPVIMRIAAVTAIVLAFVGKIGGFLGTIPKPVMGGILIVLFGTIASIGIRNMVDNRVDLSSTRNLIIVAVILVIGIGGAVFSFGQFKLQGIGLCAITGIILNLILPIPAEDKTVGSEYEDL